MMYMVCVCHLLCSVRFYETENVDSTTLLEFILSETVTRLVTDKKKSKKNTGKPKSACASFNFRSINFQN